MPTFLRLVAFLYFCIHFAKAVVQQYVTTSTPVSGSLEDWSTSYSKSMAVDHVSTSYFYGKNGAVGDNLQLDLGTPRTIKTIYMGEQTFYPNIIPMFNVYLGNTTYTGSYTSDNTLVYSGPDEGVAVFTTISTGQYLIWALSNGQDAHFSELRAYDLPDLGHYAIVTSSGLSNYAIDAMKPESLVGTTNGQQKCLRADVSSNQFTITLTWLKAVEITDIIVFTYGSNSVTSASAKTESKGVVTSCGSLVWNTSSIEQKVTCSATLIADSLTLEMNTSSTQMLGLCKIAVFGMLCTDKTISITENSWISGTTTFDLLEDTSRNIALPTLTINPVGCAFTTTWKVKRKSDDADMTLIFPTVFAITAPNLVLSHTIVNFSQRLALYGNIDYYFIGTINDYATTETSRFYFKIDFQDECRTASIIAQTITIASPTYLVDMSKTTATISAFSDSIDAAYSIGICGSKQIILAAQTPAFVSVLPDVTNETLNPFKIEYDGNQAVDADVGLTHVINYTVRLKEYVGLAADHQASFQFQIMCPAIVTSSSLTVATQASNFYDAADPSKGKIDAPQISLQPSLCFTITGYEIAFKSRPLDDATQFIKADGSEFQIETNDRKFVGLHQLTVKNIVSNGEKVEEHDFDLTIYDSCNSTQLVVQSKIGEVKTRALEQNALRLTQVAFTDSVSVEYGVEALCGNVLYTVMTSQLNTAPFIISIEHFGGASTYTIVVDTKTYGNANTFKLILRGQLENYVDSSILLDQSFNLVIEESNNVYKPPTDTDTEDVKDEKVPVTQDVVLPDEPKEEQYTEMIEKLLGEQDYAANEVREQVNAFQLLYPYPVPYISRLTQVGFIDVSFTESMIHIPDQIDLKTLEYEAEPGVWRPVLTVEVIPEASQNPNYIGIDWEILQISPSLMTFQIYYENPLWISYVKPDYIRINFADANLFISQNGIKIPEKHLVLERQLMRQLPLENEPTQQEINASVDDSKVVLIIVLVVNIALQAGLSTFILTLRQLQIIIIIPLFESSMPANAGMVFKRLAQMAAFDYIEIGDYVDDFLELEPTEPISSKMETLGFETRQFINNVGTFSIYIAACIFAFAIWLLIVILNVATKRCDTLRRKLGVQLFWNRLNKGIFESILIVAFCSLIQFKYNLRFDSWGQKVQSWVSILVLVSYILIPAYTLIKLLYKFDELKVFSKDLFTSFGALYEGLAVKNGRKVLLEPIAFLTRRIFLAILVVFGSKTFIWQMIPLLLSNLVIMIITFATESLTSAAERRLQTFAEMSTQVTSVCFLAFNMVSVEDNFTLGYATIIFVATYMFVSVIIILRNIFISARNSLRRYLAKRAYKKQRESLKINLQSTKPQRKMRMHQIRSQALDQYADWSVEDSSQSSSHSSSQSSSQDQDSIELDNSDLIVSENSSFEASASVMNQGLPDEEIKIQSDALSMQLQIPLREPKQLNFMYSREQAQSIETTYHGDITFQGTELTQIGRQYIQQGKDQLERLPLDCIPEDLVEGYEARIQSPRAPTHADKSPVFIQIETDYDEIAGASSFRQHDANIREDAKYEILPAVLQPSTFNKNNTFEMNQQRSVWSPKLPQTTSINIFNSRMDKTLSSYLKQRQSNHQSKKFQRLTDRLPYGNQILPSKPQTIDQTKAIEPGLYKSRRPKLHLEGHRRFNLS